MFSKARLERLEIFGLLENPKSADASKRRESVRTHFFLQSIIADCEEPLCEQDLQLLDKNIFCVVDADQELNHVGALRLAVVCKKSRSDALSTYEEAKTLTRRGIDRIRGPFRIVEVLGFVARIADEFGVTARQLNEQGVAFFDERSHDASDRVCSRSGRETV